MPCRPPFTDVPGETFRYERFSPNFLSPLKITLVDSSLVNWIGLLDWKVTVSRDSYDTRTDTLRFLCSLIVFTSSFFSLSLVFFQYFFLEWKRFCGGKVCSEE